MPDLAAIQSALEGLNERLKETNASTVLTNIKLDEQNAKLADLDAKLPDFVQQSRFRRVTASLVIAGMAVASLLGVTLYLNHQTTCGIRGVLVLAQTTSTRNPLPADLSPEERARAEMQREQAAEFYSKGLEKLDILWSCAGESEAVRHVTATTRP